MQQPSVVHAHRLAHRHLDEVERAAHVAPGAGGSRMVPRARNGRYGGLGNRTARVPGRWVRWIGWIGVWDAGRDLCGVDHMEHAQPYVPTATEKTARPDERIFAERAKISPPF